MTNETENQICEECGHIKWMHGNEVTKECFSPNCDCQGFKPKNNSQLSGTTTSSREKSDLTPVDNIQDNKMELESINNDFEKNWKSYLEESGKVLPNDAWVKEVCREFHRRGTIFVKKQVEEVLNDKKWLEFKEVKTNGKTKKFLVWSKCSNCYLGEIKWYPQWRHYCFVVELGKIDLATRLLVFSDRCQLQIGYFLKKLNNEHKEILEKIKSGN